MGYLWEWPATERSAPECKALEWIGSLRARIGKERKSVQGTGMDLNLTWF